MELQVLVFGDGSKHLGNLLAELPDVKGLHVDLQLALFEAGVLQKVVKEVEDMVGRLLNRYDIFLVFSLVHEFHMPHDGGQRRLDVMRDREQQFMAAFHDFLCLPLGFLGGAASSVTLVYIADNQDNKNDDKGKCGSAN